jgi:acylphosphatase
VQGVFYRANTQKVATTLGLSGWVRNMDDGGVELIAEGPEEKLHELIIWCRKGPPSAHVTGLDIEWEPLLDEFRSFNIRYS